MGYPPSPIGASDPDHTAGAAVAPPARSDEETMETYELITRAEQETDCEYCGVPLRVGMRAVYVDGRPTCTKSCAHRLDSHDAHRRRISEEERAAFYPASNHIHGRAIVRG